MIANWRRRVPVMAAALWWGSLSAIGFVAVPLLFAHMPSPALAGQMAAKLFAAQTWLALACGMLLMLSARGSNPAGRMSWAHGTLAFVLGGMLLALLGEFAIAPRIMARENLKLWHSLGSGMYLLQWMCAGMSLWKLSAADPETTA